MEKKRTGDLLKLMPDSGSTALDVGARDGHFSLLLADRFKHVIALDLEKPEVLHPRVSCVQGNAAKMDLADKSIDFVFCAEVLEHIPPPILGDVCREFERICRGTLLIGVPYRQDIRVGRTTCHSCHGKNPPWGHVNSFDEARLRKLFPGFVVDRVSFVGETTEQTNALATMLMDWAGNPYGTYQQDEVCIHCGASLAPPPDRTLTQKVLTKMAFWAQRTTAGFSSTRGNWMHMLMSRQNG